MSCSFNRNSVNANRSVTPVALSNAGSAISRSGARVMRCRRYGVGYGDADPQTMDRRKRVFHFVVYTSKGETQPGERAACSFDLRNGADEINKGLTNWFLFDREKAAHKSGALTGPEE